jgi:ribosomal-protein-alanine N-acetyltransferase
LNYEARNRKINSQTHRRELYEDILKIRSNETINQFVNRNPPKNNYDALQFILTIKENTRNQTSFYWGISLKDHPNLIGTICLWNFSEDRKKAEVGYELLPEYHRKGIMSEALAASWILHLKIYICRKLLR